MAPMELWIPVMGNLTELGQLMHEEHFRTLVLICGVENRVSGRAAQRPMDPANAEDRTMLEELVSGLGEIGGHNAFEENVLFPLIQDKGSSDLTVLLTHEHAAMAPMVQRLRTAAAEILAGGSGAPRWHEFCAAAKDLATELMFHLQKEEMVVVQQLGAYLDPGVDHALALRYEHEAHRHPGARQPAQAA
jgi:iron-sulfur cluster repair protein YtfE (RIC family)